ncbi:MAG: 3-dehydro-L-gulonate 2-dehydrogenase [Melioribacteraceae bacterium]|nr:3-dehydro-L-gulonate 2-dehydrogenase [Melioribacteraceae bacterium]
MPIIKFEELKSLLAGKLIKNGFKSDDAELCADIMAKNNLAGVASHGTNRFPELIDMVKNGYVRPGAKPSLIRSNGAWEQWDANYGPGPLNAWFATDRAIELSKEYSIGCVTLKNSNHWMRPGAYGWKAAEAGYILICWTNTIPIMPAWESKEPKIGNNPITLAVPRKKGHVVVDLALSQYSYGQLANYRRENRPLPYPGGYDQSGNLTENAAAIFDSYRALPIGYWKGAGLAILFDLIAAILSGGNATHDLGVKNIDTGMSQVFICFDPVKSMSYKQIDMIADDIILNVKSSLPADERKEVLYPGERVLNSVQHNSVNGIEVHPDIWNEINNL